MDEKTIVIGLTNEPEPLVNPEGTMVPDERTVMPSGNYDKELTGKDHAPVDEDYERTTALHAAESPEHRVVDTRSESEQPSDAHPVFVIRGNVYQATKLLSSNSGEAEIYLVSQGGTSYVLKIYFSKSPQMEMLRIVSNMHFEMIVNILDYGTLTWNGK
ncbi:MAG: hypothetical protein HUJ99_06020, partial [Bacteroidaceae bacterium]|nr:hypothetical protein [Bacteroidaceae bacterium]